MTIYKTEKGLEMKKKIHATNRDKSLEKFLPRNSKGFESIYRFLNRYLLRYKLCKKLRAKQENDDKLV